MTGTAAPETGTTTETTSTDATTEPATQPEVDWKAKAREWERRAKDNKAAADELAALKAEKLTAEERQAQAVADAQREAAEAKAEALRWRIAAKHGIADEDAELFLTGTDEETLTKQAERLAERVATTKKTGNVVPKEGTSKPPGADPIRDFARDLFAAGADS